MTNDSLAVSYQHKARVRRGRMDALVAGGEHSDVVRLAQECLELSLKAALRRAGVDPPKWNEVGPVLLDNEALFPVALRPSIPGIADLSRPVLAAGGCDARPILSSTWIYHAFLANRPRCRRTCLVLATARSAKPESEAVGAGSSTRVSRTSAGRRCPDPPPRCSSRPDARRSDAA